MRQMKYFNALLTINAVLMSALLWTQLAGWSGSGQPVLSSSANAAPQDSGAPPLSEGVPNAGKQRQFMIEELRAMRSTLDSTRNLLQSGAIKVQVTNLDEMKDSAASATTTR